VSEAPCPLESLAIAARSGTFRDPRDPRGTRPGRTWSDVAAAAGLAGQGLDVEMALYVAAHDDGAAEEIRQTLIQYVLRCCNEDGIVPRLDSVAKAVDAAMISARREAVTAPGGSRYFRWARAELLGRAQNAAAAVMQRAR